MAEQSQFSKLSKRQLFYIAEKLIDEVLAEYVCDGLLRYNEEKDLWVLTDDDLATVISWVAATKARFPQHLSLELGRQQLKRIPEYIQIEHGCN